MSVSDDPHNTWSCCDIISASIDFVPIYSSLHNLVMNNHPPFPAPMIFLKIIVLLTSLTFSPCISKIFYTTLDTSHNRLGNSSCKLFELLLWPCARLTCVVFPFHDLTIQINLLYTLLICIVSLAYVSFFHTYDPNIFTCQNADLLHWKQTKCFTFVRCLHTL